MRLPAAFSRSRTPRLAGACPVGRNALKPRFLQSRAIHAGPDSVAARPFEVKIARNFLEHLHIHLPALHRERRQHQVVANRIDQARNSLCTAVAEWFPVSERSTAMGMINAGTSVGAVVAPPLIAIVLATLNWRWGFFLSGA